MLKISFGIVLTLVGIFFLETYQYIGIACVKRPKFKKKETFIGFYTQIRFLSTQAGPKKPVSYFPGWADLLPSDFNSELPGELPYNNPDCGPNHQFLYSENSKNINKLVNEYRKVLREGKKKGKSVRVVYGKDVVSWFSEFRTFLLNSKIKSNSNFLGDSFNDLVQLFSSNLKKSKADPDVLKKLQNILFRSSCFLLSEDQVKTVTDSLSYEFYLFSSEMKRQMSSSKSDSKLNLGEDFEEKPGLLKKYLRGFFKAFQAEVFFPHLESFWKQNEDKKDARLEYQFYLHIETHDFSLLFAYIYTFLIDNVKADDVIHSKFSRLSNYRVIDSINRALYHYSYHICIRYLKKKASGLSETFFNSFFLEASSIFDTFILDGQTLKYRFRYDGPQREERGDTYNRMQFMSQYVILVVLSNMGGALLSKIEYQFDKIKSKKQKYFHFKYKKLSFSYSETFPLIVKPTERKTAHEFNSKRKQGKNNNILFEASTINYLNICDQTPYFIDKNTIKVVENVLTSEENLFFNSYKEVAVPTYDSIDREIQSMIEEVQICDQICSGFFFLLKKSNKRGRSRKEVRPRKGVELETLPSGDYLPILFDKFGAAASALMLHETFNRLKACNEKVIRLLKKKDRMEFFFIQLQYAKVLQGYKLYFLNKPDFRLRLWSFVGGNVLFSRNRGFSKYFVCGPTLELTFSGLKSLLKSYCTFNKKAVPFFELVEAGIDVFRTMKEVRLDMFKTLKLTNQEKGKDYFFLSLLELTIEESLLTKETGFLMPVDQKSSVWVFTGLFFRNRKIMELTRILANPSELNLISYLQQESKDLLFMVLKTQGPVTQEFYNNAVLLVDLFSNNRDYHKKISMIVLLGAGRLSIENTLNELLLEQELIISDSFKSVISSVLDNYDDFLNQKLDNIMTQIKLFKTFSMKYFKVKFNYIQKQIKNKIVLIKKHQSILKNSTENSESFLQTDNFIKSLKKDIIELEKKSCFSFRILSGEIGFSQDIVESYVRKQISLPLFTENQKMTLRKRQLHYLELRGNLPATRRQLMSSMIHSMESTILRDILLSLDKEGIQINHCHDCFQVHPNYYEKFIATVHKVYFQRFKTSSPFWDLSNTLVNLDGVFWLDDPILTADQRLDLQKKFDKFTCTFHFKKMHNDWVWSREDAISSYPFENK